MIVTPTNSFLDLLCPTLASPRAELHGDEIVYSSEQLGQPFAQSRRGTESVLEAFVSTEQDAESILRFTRRFGPLRRPLRGAKEFRQPLEAWRNYQNWFRQVWRSRAGNAPQLIKFRAKSENVPEERYFSITDAQSWPLEKGEHLLISREGRVGLLTENLERFLRFQLLSLPLGRARICRRPDCATPYFIAKHQRQNFCSDLCAQWGQRQWKKNWWAEHGEAWRKQRTKQPKGSKRGSSRTR